MLFRNTLAILLLLAAGTAHAASWPGTKPIRIVQGFSPGSAPQMLALEIGQLLSEKMGASIYVESKQGASGNISAEAVAKAPPDGHTLYVTTTGTMAINPSLYGHLSFDPTKDFEPVALLGYVPNIIIVNKKLPVNTLSEFVDYVKKNPGKVNYGTSGVGTSQHLAMEQFSSAANIKLTHVPYGKGSAATDLIGGRIEAMFHQLPAALGFIQSGDVKPLAVSTKQRVPVVKDVPTVAESGFPNYESVTWFALFAPKGTPEEIINEINKLISDSMNGPLGKKLTDTGIIPQSATPAQLGKILAQDTKIWSGVVKKLGLKLD